MFRTWNCIFPLILFFLAVRNGSADAADPPAKQLIIGTWELVRWTGDDGRDFREFIDYRGWTRQFTADGKMTTKSKGSPEIKRYVFVSQSKIETVWIDPRTREPDERTRKQESLVVTKDKLVIDSPEGHMEFKRRVEGKGKKSASV